MAKLPVKLQNIFGGSLTPLGNIARFGSLALGAPAYSGDPADIQSLAAWLNGWAPALINAPGGLSSPALEDLNAIIYVLTYQIAYLKQAGLAEWDPTVTYYIGSWANVAGVPYVSKVDNNTNNSPATNPTQWKTYASTLLGASDPLNKAWVIFDGRGSNLIDSSFNVSTVVRQSAGIYDITFAAPMTTATYGFTGSCGTRPASGWISGDDNIIVGGVSGKTAIRTQATCRVFAFDRGDNATQDSSMISLNFFGP